MRCDLKLSAAALALSLFSGCGGGGGSGNQSAIAVTPIVAGATGIQWPLSRIASAGFLDGSPQAGEATCGSYDIVASGDLNGDGYTDLVLGPKVCFDSNGGIGYKKLILAYYDPGTQSYRSEAATQARMPSMQWAHSAIIGDFNNDGFTDLFVAGTGTDYRQPCGEAPVLLLGSKEGWVDASRMLPRFSMYSHQAVANDFNGDGKTDFLILNNGWVPVANDDPRQKDCSYRQWPGSNASFLILSTLDSWKVTEFNILDKSGARLLDGTQSFNSMASGDVNGDGKADLVIAGGNWGTLAHKTMTLLGDGAGRFEWVSSFSELPYGADTVAAQMSIRQIDGVGAPELLINYAKHPGAQAMPFQYSTYGVFRFVAVMP